ncbi:hypothetical protein J6590_085622 [Homalodisca vitripennis]|nr:hypothetical protein J6590_045200 [Homalodisca vitripennis]KAG8295191.1 hypothetical protein J6590_085622 [Homalodisca vitripennis]
MAVRVICGIGSRESCREIFPREHPLTLPSLFQGGHKVCGPGTDGGSRPYCGQQSATHLCGLAAAHRAGERHWYTVLAYGVTYTMVAILEEFQNNMSALDFPKPLLNPHKSGVEITLALPEALSRSAQHRLHAYEALPSEVGAKLFNKLPLDLRVENSKPLFKRKLRRLLVQGAYYSVGELDHED